MSQTDEEKEADNRVLPIAEAFEAAPAPSEIAENDEAPTTTKRRGRPKGVRNGEGLGRTRDRKETATLPRWKDGAIAAFVTQVYMMGGSALKGSRNERLQQYGEVCIMVGEPAGIVWEKLAKRHEALRRFFAKCMEGSEYTELMMVHAPIFMMIFADMGILRVPQHIVDEFDEEMAKVA